MGRRYYSIKEINDKLRRKKYPEELIKAIIALLEGEGLLNDFRFATAWVRDRLNFKPRGKTLLVRELKFRGISNEIIDQIIDKEFPEDDNELARRAIAPKIQLYTKLDRETGIRRVKGFLARRGFSYTTVSNIVSEIFNGDG